MRRTKLLWTFLALALVAVLSFGLLPASAAPDVSVKISHFQYRDRNPIVHPGDLVGVYNVDGRVHGIPHSLTSDSGAFDTGVFVRGTQSFRAPTSAGDYPFHCVVHPEMRGVLRVHSNSIT